MSDVWSVLLPILLADIVNPVLFAFMVYASGTARPIANGIAVLLGHTFAYIAAGFVLALGLEEISERLYNPYMIDYLLEIPIGILLLYVAFKSRNKKEKQLEKNSELTTLKALWMGMIMNVVGLPFALPYFAAIDQILKADLTASTAMLTLAGYNLLYALPFTAVPIIAAIFGERSQELLERMNNTLNRISDVLMPLLLGLVGLALLADAILYFTTGTGLF